MDGCSSPPAKIHLSPDFNKCCHLKFAKIEKHWSEGRSKITLPLQRLPSQTERKLNCAASVLPSGYMFFKSSNNQSTGPMYSLSIHWSRKSECKWIDKLSGKTILHNVGKPLEVDRGHFRTSKLLLFDFFFLSLWNYNSQKDQDVPVRQGGPLFGLALKRQGGGA